jgi:hypothetical protein
MNSIEVQHDWTASRAVGTYLSSSIGNAMILCEHCGMGHDVLLRPFHTLSLSEQYRIRVIRSLLSHADQQVKVQSPPAGHIGIWPPVLILGNFGDCCDDDTARRMLMGISSFVRQHHLYHIIISTSDETIVNGLDAAWTLYTATRLLRHGATSSSQPDPPLSSSPSSLSSAPIAVPVQVRSSVSSLPLSTLATFAPTEHTSSLPSSSPSSLSSSSLPSVPAVSSLAPYPTIPLSIVNDMSRPEMEVSTTSSTTSGGAGAENVSVNTTNETTSSSSSRPIRQAAMGRGTVSNKAIWKCPLCSITLTGVINCDEESRRQHYMNCKKRRSLADLFPLLPSSSSSSSLESKGVNEIIIELRVCPRSLWKWFKHYYNGNDVSLHDTCACWIARWNGSIVGFISVTSGSLRRREIRMEHRLVVLPSYQHMGIGNRISNAIAHAMTYNNPTIDYISVTNHPSLMYHRNASPSLWMPLQWKVHYCNCLHCITRVECSMLLFGVCLDMKTGIR